MKILIHGINYAPEQIGIGKYTGEMAEWLAARKHEVRVVAAPPYYPSWKVSDGYPAWWYRREESTGIIVWRCPLWVPAKPAAISRIFHLASFALSSLPILLSQSFWKPDIVISIEPTLFCAPQSWLIARLSGAKAWLHVQDFEIEAFFGLGFGSSSLLKRVLMNLEAWLMRRFDHISTISKTMLARIVCLNRTEKNTSLFPNWVDVSHIRADHEGRDLRAEWGIDADKRVVLYSGNMGNKQGLEIVLDAAKTLMKTHPHIVFVLVGEGVAKAGLVDQANAHSLTNVIFRPLQPVEDLPSLLAMADLHLIIQKRRAANAVMPSKLTGILAAGGHSIITADADTELGKLVNNNPGIAVLVEPDCRDALVDAVSGVLEPSKRMNKFNVVARAYAEQHLAQDVILQDIEQELLKLIEEKAMQR